MATDAPPKPKDPVKQRAAALAHYSRYREEKVIDIRDLHPIERRLIHALIAAARSGRANREQKVTPE